MGRQGTGIRQFSIILGNLSGKILLFAIYGWLPVYLDRGPVAGLVYPHVEIDMG